MLNILLLTTRHTNEFSYSFCLRVYWNWWRSVTHRKCVWRDCKQIETGQKIIFSSNICLCVMSNLCRSLCGFCYLGYFLQFLIFMVRCKSSARDHKNVAVWRSIDQLHGVSQGVFALEKKLHAMQGKDIWSIENKKWKYKIIFEQRVKVRILKS